MLASQYIMEKMSLNFLHKQISCATIMHCKLNNERGACEQAERKSSTSTRNLI